MLKTVTKLATLSAFLCASNIAVAAPKSWEHEETGIVIGGGTGDLTLNEVNDSNKNDNILQFGSNGDRATVYLYRAAYPNAALWYERTRSSMDMHFKNKLLNKEPPIRFTLGSGETPNGLRWSSNIGIGGGYNATSVAIVHHDQWLLKFRYSSQTLNAEQTSQKLDQLLTFVQLGKTAAIPIALDVPKACEDRKKFTGSFIKPKDKEAAPVMLELLAVLPEVSGFGGLAQEPENWCQDRSTNIKPMFGSVYRSMTAPEQWVLIFNDSGKTVTGRGMTMMEMTNEIAKKKGDKVEKFKTGGALFVSHNGKIEVAGLFDGIPQPNMKAVIAGVEIGFRGKNGLYSISMNKSEDTEEK